MKHYVYSILNKKTGSIYIGSRSHCNPEQDNYMGSSKILTRVIEEQGIVNFEKKVLAEFLTRKEANRHETDIVRDLLQHSPEKTYNRRIPGEPVQEKQHNIRADIWNDYFEDIRKEYLMIPNMSKLARKYSTTVGTIKKIVQDIQIKGYRPDIWQLSETIRKKYGSGSSLKELSQQFKCDIGTVKAVLQKENIVIRTYSEQYSIDLELQQKRKQQTVVIDIEKVKKLYYEEHLTVGQIAEKLGVYRGTLEKRMKDVKMVIRNNSFYRKKRHPVWKQLEEFQKDLKVLTEKEICKKYDIKDRSTFEKLLMQTKVDQ
jgi:hypothetical protein